MLDGAANEVQFQPGSRLSVVPAVDGEPMGVGGQVVRHGQRQPGVGRGLEEVADGRTVLSSHLRRAAIAPIRLPRI